MVKARYVSIGKGGMKIFNKEKEKIPEVVKKIIAESDIILEVLDARFPKETQNKEIEDYIKSKGKKIIYILNKSDLIESMKKSFLFPSIYVSSKKRNGGRILRDRIKIEAKKIKKDKITVGVIGYPNTGKSSLINLLIGKSSARFSAEAGFTKGVQKLRLSPKILLLDSPGVIPNEEYSTTGKFSGKHAEIGVKTYDKIKDPEIMVAELMKKYPHIIENFYKIDTEGDSEILLEKLGKQKRFFKKGGEVNTDTSARLILKDWQMGNIKVKNSKFLADEKLLAKSWLSKKDDESFSYLQ
ncbi:MAG: GTPase [Candidatus Pacearchaeota archaeon]